MYNKIFEIFKEGNTKEALNLALEIYNNNKKNDRACRMLGEIYLKIKNFEKSEFFFKKAIKINPKKEYFFSIGYFYDSEANVDSALKYYTWINEVHPKSNQAKQASIRLNEINSALSNISNDTTVNNNQERN